ncbi:alpha/beta fold hydrolase [Pelagicoccus sp. SDUM812002]|uniref:alpha/beta hydrolase n=1 Tax=Pelagicoccus sp. SDUM812002 TaxID=3041266 RepID=UPI00280DF1EB|nr:alpha/beta fold hydrolase [Pelagicoccus sp. SDUM812002]MDQ8185377.1 alpha/beta fold hydrolase [Pelagicoccus sp. SDUM812002]
MFDTVKNNQGERLDCSYQQADPQAPSEWLYVLGHGVTGNKDRPIIVESAAALNAAGFDTLAFSFSGNGDSEGRFEDSNVSKEVEDLGSVLDAIGDRKIAYLGHSMGGAVGVLRAANDPRIQRLVSLAGMVDTKKFALTEFGDETPDQGLMWDEESYPLSQAFMTDLCETVGSVIEAAKRVSIPWLLLHGTEDDVVLIEDSESIAALSKEEVTFKKIEGADHSFDGAREVATQALTNWALKV